MSDGMGCKCAARCETECCCDDVSWEPKEIQTARFKIADLTLKLAAANALIASKDALIEQAREALAEAFDHDVTHISGRVLIESGDVYRCRDALAAIRKEMK